ncbi:uncharacterized protein BXIN_2324 [Babesia sp. Xinjiang]|uniref:uncharacterized protein n=1 Tax=Babesia sp. Xinjiang TaxID=462227 RepID=UPI000A235629|nr:uncharacterized protein BXIN_2324 [Babesia sp. Xinjiang]ORM40794.1 hypothetical protein BXIN_2324 [Babesia sp. Xinjiang]
MAGIELLYKPTGRSVIDLRSNIANDLRQRSIAKRLDGNRKNSNRENRCTDNNNRAGWPPLKTSELRSIPSSELVYSRIDESVCNAKNTLKSLKVPDVDVENARQEYIQKVGRDYSTVGLTSYILAQKDAKEFRERCYHILSKRVKNSSPEGGFDTSEAPFFTNRTTQNGRHRTPDDVLLSSFGKNDHMADFECMDNLFSSPAKANRGDAINVTSPFATQAQWSENARSMLSEERESDHGFTIGQMRDSDYDHADDFNFKRVLRSPAQRSNAPPASTPEKASADSQQSRLRIVEELLEENRHNIPEELDLKTLGYAEKRKLLRQLGFGDDYIANRLCDRYTGSQKRKNKKLTPLEAFNMYDRQDMNESMQVHKDLSVEFSRYVKSTEPSSVTTRPNVTPADL